MVRAALAAQRVEPGAAQPEARSPQLAAARPELGAAGVAQEALAAQWERAALPGQPPQALRGQLEPTREEVRELPLLPPAAALWDEALREELAQGWSVAFEAGSARRQASKYETDPPSS
jgi:hypothetical protein